VTEPAAVRLLIEGRVQGVFFRGSAQTAASRLGLSGWVRNLPGGHVEARAEGPPERVDEFVAWCHRGPAGAIVTDVRVERIEPTGETTGFRIIR
jgi:acylphosphatase